MIDCNQCRDTGWYENNAATHRCNCLIGKSQERSERPKKLSIRIEIDPKHLEYLGSSCDSAYWCELKHNAKGEAFAREHNREERGKPGPWVKLTDKRRLLGLQRLAKLNPYQFGQYLDGNADSITGDCWLQSTVLGEIKYG